MSGNGGPPVTIGIDVGTTSVKAVAVDAEGRILARTRRPHELRVPAPGLLEHDAASAWHAGPLAAWADVRRAGDPQAVCVAAMVPSLTAVDDRGVPLGAGLLYGDARGEAIADLPPVGNEEWVDSFATWRAATATPPGSGRRKPSSTTPSAGWRPSTPPLR